MPFQRQFPQIPLKASLEEDLVKKQVLVLLNQSLECNLQSLFPCPKASRLLLQPFLLLYNASQRAGRRPLSRNFPARQLADIALKNPEQGVPANRKSGRLREDAIFPLPLQRFLLTWSILHCGLGSFRALRKVCAYEQVLNRL